MHLDPHIKLHFYRKIWLYLLTVLLAKVTWTLVQHWLCSFWLANSGARGAAQIETHRHTHTQTQLASQHQILHYCKIFLIVRKLGSWRISEWKFSWLQSPLVALGGCQLHLGTLTFSSLQQPGLAYGCSPVGLVYGHRRSQFLTPC